MYYLYQFKITFEGDSSITIKISSFKHLMNLLIIRIFVHGF